MLYYSDNDNNILIASDTPISSYIEITKEEYEAKLVEIAATAQEELEAARIAELTAELEELKAKQQKRVSN